MAAPFKASLITPESVVLETMVVSAQVPAFDGLVGVLHRRAPLLARLATGVLRLDTTGAGGGSGGGAQRYFVSGGYAQMKDDELTILTTEAIPAGQVTAEMISKEQEKLAGIKGVDKDAMEQRAAVQARIYTMRGLVGSAN